MKFPSRRQHSMPITTLSFPWYAPIKWWIKDRLRSLSSQAEAKLHRWQGGYECVDCGTLTRFKQPDYMGNVNGRRMMLSYSCYHLGFGKTRCPYCLSSRIAAYWDRAADLTGDAYADTSAGVCTGTCNWTGDQPTLVIGGIRSYRNQLARELGLNSVIIGGEWWNGYTASLPAIQQLLTVTGVARTSITRWCKDEPQEYSDGRIWSTAQPVTEITSTTVLLDE